MQDKLLPVPEGVEEKLGHRLFNDDLNSIDNVGLNIQRRKLGN